ncbi:MAG: PadR family transcriptional regulator, partial [Stackebrandtia sp.]
DTGLPSGTLYPILVRLERAGWVATAWEDVDASAAGRPARRYYRLTADGVTAARAELSSMYRRLSRLPGIAGEGSPA